MKSYTKSLGLKSIVFTSDLDNKHLMNAALSQLGTLALRQGELNEAVMRYKEAVSLSHSLNEPINEAINIHQLGLVYQEAKQWEAAEQAYREALWLKEEHGLLGGSNGAGATWDQLAQVCQVTGRVAEAEQWYNKALAAFQTAGDRPGIARTLNNFANLLANDSVRLDEARVLAEESLAIKETLNLRAAEIWIIYNLLARIAARQDESSQAVAYQAKSRQAYLVFPDWRQDIRQHDPLIAAVVQATTDLAVREQLEPLWDKLAGGAGANLITAIRSLLNGERDEAALCEPLGYVEAAVIRAILEGIAGDA